MRTLKTLAIIQTLIGLCIAASVKFEDDELCQSEHYSLNFNIPTNLIL